MLQIQEVRSNCVRHEIKKAKDASGDIQTHKGTAMVSRPAGQLHHGRNEVQDCGQASIHQFLQLNNIQIFEVNTFT